MYQMRIISRRTLSNFWKKHSDSEQPLKAWHAEVEKAHWVGPQEIKKRYPSASLLLNNRVVFNIKGNTYRLIVVIKYEYSIVYIRFIGTHKEYDKIDARTI